MSIQEVSFGSHPVVNRYGTQDDSAQLAALGYKQELRRKFSFLSMLGLAFSILNSWTALSASLPLALPSGGPASVIWGLVAAAFCNLCLSASLAEFLSAYPVSSGQYFWAGAVSWQGWQSVISWVTGWINVAGWVALSCTGGILGGQLILNAVIFFDPSFEPKAWHSFLLYLAYTLVAFLINTFMSRILHIITKAAFIWSLTGFVVICITVLACAAPNYQSGAMVYTHFTNNTGWPDGLAWLLGLLQGALGVTGFDAVAHMIEEIPHPSHTAPRIIIICVAIGLATGFVFLSVLLFVLKDLDYVVSSPNGPLLQIFYDATNSKAGSVCLLIFPLVCIMFGSISISATSSRMIYAFARDGGLPFSHVFAKVHTGLDVPLNALYLTNALVVAFGCVLLGSSSAMNAIVSASVVALGVSYAMPVAVNMLRGRKALPEDRPFKIPEPWGWILNLIGVLSTLLTTILFLFPPSKDVTAGNMNYCIVAFAVILVISVVQWFVDGRKNFRGPNAAEVQSMDGIEWIDQKAADEGKVADKMN